MGEVATGVGEATGGNENRFLRETVPRRIDGRDIGGDSGLKNVGPKSEVRDSII